MSERTNSKFATGRSLTEALGIKGEDDYFAFHSRRTTSLSVRLSASLEELKEKLSTHEAVADADLIAIPDETRWKDLKAFVLFASDYEASESLRERPWEYTQDRLALLMNATVRHI